MHCIICKTPAHESTGWILQRPSDNKNTVILCKNCANDFYKWLKGRFHNPLTLDNFRKKIE